jgi:transcriptional regulator with AAA-type ATPase domain
MPVPIVGRAAALDEVRQCGAQGEAVAAGLPVIITGRGGTGKSRRGGARTPVAAGS